MGDAQRGRAAGSAATATEEAARVVERALEGLRDAEADANGGRDGTDAAGHARTGVTWESPEPGSYVVTLPGTRKLSTTCSLRVGRHSLSLNAFVVRHPDERADRVHRWLLERNLRLYGVSYAIDRLGDVYLTARLPLAAVTEDELDRLLGAVLEEADGSFNTLLELGFAEAIRKEYAWRVSRGESTRNLAAFTHLTGENEA
ncbi:YbjN domain-containing protein [Streptomyces montanisoli]|uniref:YbjN domain-containing protein n=1 Tax=Streptomyces montanisoli TaxID=2798581 RepID=A0A940MGV1_9ACTN|nr:YbjN domain-containing protein [Streptomyces montanisoli]MBP0459357.1 YbjN domain-containing protein [Streptomyces montanisoli]